MIKKRMAEVVLRQESINRLAHGQIVTIRFEDLEIDLRFDPLARLGSGSTLEDMFADAMHLGRRG
jgi:hypothetical protein